MIAAVTRAIDHFFGRGEAAVTVPPLDGALQPNRLLDDAKKRMPLADADCLAVVGGKLLVSASDTVHSLGAKGRWKPFFKADSAIACIAPVGEDGLAIALASGEIVISGGPFDGRRYSAGQDVSCLTAMAGSGDTLYLANGSATHPAHDWQRDLLERNASGSVWRIDLQGGGAERLANGLAWPAGIAVDEDSLVVSQAWKHALTRFDPADPSRVETLYHDLPGYPGRLSRSADGWWLAVFAPRSQLVEFILREPTYRRRMLDEVPKEYWISPKLRSGRSFYEPLQGGGVKHLGLLKPWSPTMSAGLCVRLDASFQPVASLQSRADGATHGVTSVLEKDGEVFAAARGDGVVVAVPGSLAGGEA